MIPSDAWEETVYLWRLNDSINLKKKIIQSERNESNIYHVSEYIQHVNA